MVKYIWKSILKILFVIILIIYLIYNLLIILKLENQNSFSKLVKIIAPNLYQYNILLALIIIMFMIMLLLSLDFSRIGRSIAILFLMGGIISIGINVFYIANVYLNTPFINNLLVYTEENQVDASLYYKYSKKILMNTETGNSVDLYSPSNSIEKIVIFIPDYSTGNADKIFQYKKMQEMLLTNGISLAFVKINDKENKSIEIVTDEISLIIEEIDIFYSRKYDIIVSGNSMGGYFAFSTLLNRNLNIDGLALFYPIINLEDYYNKYNENSNLINSIVNIKNIGSENNGDCSLLMKSLFGNEKESIYKNLKFTSMIADIDKIKKNMPVFISVGEHDSIINIEELKEVVQNLNEKSINTTYFTLPYTEHYYDLIMDNKSFAARRTYEEFIRWIKKNTKNSVSEIPI